MANPFDRFDSSRPNPFVDPYKAHAEQRQDRQTDLSAGSLAVSQANAAREASRQAAMLPSEQRISIANAEKAERENDQKRAEAALSTMTANSNLQGEAFLKQSGIPEAQWPVIRAYARGDLGSRSGGLSTSMLPIIQAAMNYDHSASGVNFPARVKMQTDLAGNQPGTAGGALRAMERMLMHGAEVLRAGQTLNNYGPGIMGSMGNAAVTAYRHAADNPDLNFYNQLVKNYAPEAQKAIAQTSGGVSERQERAEGFSAASSQQSRVAALQADAKQEFDAMGAVNNQYKRLMGRDITDVLSPDAKKAYDLIMSGGTDQQGKPMFPAVGFVPISTNDSSLPPPEGGAAPNQPGLSPAGGSGRDFVSQRDQALADEAHAAYVGGATKAQIDAIAAKYGQGPYGKSLEDAITRRDGPEHFLGFQFQPGATGHQDVSGIANTVANAVGSVPGSYSAGMANALSFNHLGDIAQLTGGSQGGSEVAMRMARDTGGGVPFGLGTLAGDTAGVLATGGILGKTAQLTGAPILGAIADSPAAVNSIYGGAQGAASDPSHPIVGGALGVGSALLGGKIGEGIAGLRTPVGVDKLQPGERMILNAANKAEPDSVANFLTQASDLGVPASLADAAPALNSLTGASIRRSPVAAALAQKTLGARGRGQYDRLIQNIGDNLGPVENIPQRSEDLIKQARIDAGPLYDAAYAAPGAGAVYPKISDLLARPSMRSALGKAETIAAEEGRDPTALGFEFDPQGNTVLNRVPSWQTVDYAKRGLDDVLEGYRDGTTGKLNLDEWGRAIEGTRKSLLSTVDPMNPDYALARATYAGPAAERDALAMGQDAVSLSPNQLSVNIGNSTPSQIDQMRLGFQSKLAENAGRLRYGTNPYGSTLDTPGMEQRLNALYGNSETSDVARLLAQRDMEGQLASSSNRMIGNSMTAERQGADAAFDANPLVEAGLHGAAAVATHGASLPGTAARIAGVSLRDRIALGLSRGAEQRAEQIAPITLNTDPVQALASLQSLQQRAQQYQVAKALLASQGAIPGQVAGATIPAALLSTYGGQ